MKSFELPTSVAKEQERKEKIRWEKTLFVLSSAVMIEALKGNEVRAKKILRKNGAPVRRRVLDAISRLKDWIADMEK